MSLLQSLVTVICPRSWDVGERVVAWVRLHGHQIRFKNPEKGQKREARKDRNAGWKRKETTNEETYTKTLIN
jgi:hypothetical protein